MKIFRKPKQSTIVPLEFGMYYPDWNFERKHGERNCDSMVRRISMFDSKNGAWVMCSHKASVIDESTGLQHCHRHLKHRTPITCTHSQAIGILEKRAEVREATQELFRAGEETPLLKALNEDQKRVEKASKGEWGESLTWLDKLVANAFDCWAATAQHYREDKGEVGPTLRMLFGQACTLARAIVSQCRSGHIQSAIVLWRSLFEIEVNMAYIARDTTQVPSRAERYNDWSIANYLYVNNLLAHEALIELKRKYSGWNLRHHEGWTAPPDNPKASLDVPSRARPVGHVEKNKRDGGYSHLDIYTLSHSYVHNNVFGMLNDPLTLRGESQYGPSSLGLDTPICLTAISLVRITHLLLDHKPNSEFAHFGKFADIQTSQVQSEVSMVPEDLLSPLGGIDVSIVIQSDDGREHVVTPKRRH